MEFKVIQQKRGKVNVIILIESQWNLKNGFYEQAEKQQQYINRITVEFKV